MNIIPWELERANIAAEDAMRNAIAQAMCIPRHIITEGHQRDIERLGKITPFPALSQPRHSTLSKPGIVGHGENDG